MIYLYSEHVSVHFIFIILYLIICIFVGLPIYQHITKSWTNLWENCRTVMATSRICRKKHLFILGIRICQETQETETEALPPERSSLRQRKVSDKPVTTTVSWQSEVPVLSLVGLSILKPSQDWHHEISWIIWMNIDAIQPFFFKRWHCLLGSSTLAVRKWGEITQTQLSTYWFFRIYHAIHPLFVT